MRLFPLQLTLLFAVLVLPLSLSAQREKLSPEDLEYVEKTWPNAKATGTCLRTEVLAEGTGDSPKPGDRVSVLYKGMLLDGTVFDQAVSPERPFVFRLGRGNVIEGWEEGLQLMKTGEKRRLIIPFELAYGTRGDPPKIPRRATLVFEVELIKIEKGEPAPPPPPPKKKEKGK